MNLLNHRRIAEAIQAARGGRSAQDIADETARLGYKVSRDSITNIENGRKSTLDICELLILAAALDVPAVALVFPNLPDGEVELLPGQVMPAENALFRFTGEHGRRSTAPRSNLGKLLKLTRERFAKEIERATLSTGIDKMLAAATGTDRDKQIAAAGRLMAAADTGAQIDDLNGRMAEIPGAVVIKGGEQQ